MGSLDGKVAWVTGAGSGIGQLAALELARAGATVAISGRRAAALAESKTLIGKAGGKADVVALDVADKEAVEHAATVILETHGRLDILVNSAGLNVQKRYLKDLAASDWDRVIDVNLNGAMYCTLAALRPMRDRGDGLVINISSWLARNPGYLGGAAYFASKQALAAMTHQINIEEGIHGIRGCVIYPGEVATPLVKQRPKPVPAAELERMLKPEDLGRLVRFVAESPAHVCLNEIVISPTWNRLLIGGEDLRLSPEVGK